MSTRETKNTKNVPTAAMADTPLGGKIIRNAMFGGLRYIFIAPIPFIMTPLILHEIGVKGYGTWAVFLAINALTSLADLGLVGTLSKFVAEYYAHRDFAALSRALNSGLAVFLLLAATIGSSLWIATPWIAGLLFHGSNVPPTELIALFRCFLIVIAANIVNLLFSSVTTGLQRLDLTNMISAANVFLNALFSACLLLGGLGLRGLVYGYSAAAIITVVTYVLTVRRLLPQVAINPRHFDKHEARKMFGFSFRLYVTQAAVAVHNQIEKVFLAILVGVAPVGWYDIASDVALKIRGAIGFILSPVLPAASELNALGDETRIRELYYRSQKYLALIGVPAICFVVAISSRFVDLWIGPQLKIVAFPLSVLVVVSFINLITGPGFLIFAGSGYLKPGVDSAILGIVVNLLLSFGLIYKFGFAGAVIGTSAALVLASGYFITVFHRHTHYSFARLLRESYLKPALCSLFVLAAILAVHTPSDLGWLGLVLMGLIFGGLYTIVILLSRFFDAYDWTKMEAFVPGVRQVRRLGRVAWLQR
ncbi:MAG: oligosaccharide flippase family protein [Candidatus Sulfotelmatobacter sp.]